MRTAAAIAAKVPMPIPLRVPVVVRVSRSSLIESLHIVALLQAITPPNVPNPPIRPGAGADVAFRLDCRKRGGRTRKRESGPIGPRVEGARIVDGLLAAGRCAIIDDFATSRQCE